MKYSVAKREQIDKTQTMSQDAKPIDLIALFASKFVTVQQISR